MARAFVFTLLAPLLLQRTAAAEGYWAESPLWNALGQATSDQPPLSIPLADGYTCEAPYGDVSLHIIIPVVTRASYRQLHYLGMLGLTNASVFTYLRKDPGDARQVRVDLPCGMTWSEHLLLPNQADEAAALFTHVALHYDRLPDALVLLHGGFLHSWHSKCSVAVRRLRAFYRGLGTGEQATPALRDFASRAQTLNSCVRSGVYKDCCGALFCHARNSREYGEGCPWEKVGEAAVTLHGRPNVTQPLCKLRRRTPDSDWTVLGSDVPEFFINRGAILQKYADQPELLTPLPDASEGAPAHRRLRSSPALDRAQRTHDRRPLHGGGESATAARPRTGRRLRASPTFAAAAHDAVGTMLDRLLRARAEAEPVGAGGGGAAPESSHPSWGGALGGNETTKAQARLERLWASLNWVAASHTQHHRRDSAPPPPPAAAAGRRRRSLTQAADGGGDARLQRPQRPYRTMGRLLDARGSQPGHEQLQSLVDGLRQSQDRLHALLDRLGATSGEVLASAPLPDAHAETTSEQPARNRQELDAGGGTQTTGLSDAPPLENAKDTLFPRNRASDLVPPLGGKDMSGGRNGVIYQPLRFWVNFLAAHGLLDRVKRPPAPGEWDQDWASMQIVAPRHVLQRCSKAWWQDAAYFLTYIGWIERDAWPTVLGFMVEWHFWPMVDQRYARAEDLQVYVDVDRELGEDPTLAACGAGVVLAQEN